MTDQERLKQWQRTWNWRASTESDALDKRVLLADALAAGHAAEAIDKLTALEAENCTLAETVRGMREHDGTETQVDLWVKYLKGNAQREANCYWIPELKQWRNSRGYEFNVQRITHFRPLPAPPEVQG